MGNILTCKKCKTEISGVVLQCKRGTFSQYKMLAEEELLHHNALAIAIQQHHLSRRFESSTLRQIGSITSPRRELPESISSTKQVPVFLDNLETKKIVLVHGEGFGAWCWYKIISLLEEVGLQPVALNLTSCGTDHTDVNSIRTLAEYTKPLIDFLYNLPEDEKVILVGHSVGAASISLALESYPKKITKAVFICATMIRDGHRPIDVFTEELASADVFLKESKLLMYGNGKDQSPTSIMFDKEQTKGLYFNQSPSKDVALSALSMRPIPLVQIMEKLSLTEENYGSVRRFYVQTLDDRMLSLDTQEKIVRENPPDGVYKIKGSDHCPFFSKPLSLNKILLEIAQLP